MKKSLVFCVALLALLVPLQGFSSGKPELAAKEAPAGKPKIAVVVLDLTGNYFQIKLAEKAKQVGESLGAEISVHAAGFGEFAGQVAIIENLIAKKVDLIILNAAHPIAVNDAIEKAYKAGIPVIHIDNKSTSDKPLTYAGTDNIQGAYMGGLYVAKKIGGKGKVALLTGEAGEVNEGYRTQGFEKAMSEYPNIKIVGKQNAHWTEEGGLAATENILQANPDLDAIFAENDGAAFGAAIACKAKGVRPLIVGYDGIPEAIDAIKKGTIDATVAQFPDKMAEVGVRLGLAYLYYLRPLEKLFDAPLIPSFINTGVKLFDKTNVSEY